LPIPDPHSYSLSYTSKELPSRSRNHSLLRFPVKNYNTIPTPSFTMKIFKIAFLFIGIAAANPGAIPEALEPRSCAKR
jgi:hypothetical protein